MKTLEDFIKKNKNKIELSDVNPDIWSNIEREFSQKSRHRHIQYLLPIAASLLLSIFILFQYVGSKNSATFEYEKLIATIHHKENLIQNMALPQSYKTDIKRLVKQLHDMDKQVKPQLIYLNNGFYEDYIVQQVYEYYQQKNQLLDKLINEITRLNNNQRTFKNNNDENTTITI